MATLDFDYTPAKATGTTASIIATATWAFDVNTPVVASAVRVSDGVVVSPATITAKDYQTKQFTVLNPWGNGVQATVVVERRVVPTQEFDPSTTENLNLRSLSAQLAETTKALAQVYAFTYGNAVLAQPGLGIWSYDAFQVAPIGARKGKIIRFHETTGAPVYVVSALTEEESEYLYNHTHPISDVTGLQAALDGKAPLNHTHTMEQITGLVSALAGKAPLAHTHPIADVTGLRGELDSILAAIAGINPGYGEGDDADFDRIVCTSLEAQTFAWGKEALAVGSTQQWVLSVVAASPNGHALQFQYKAAINDPLVEYVRLDTQGFRPGPAAGSSLNLGTSAVPWLNLFADTVNTDAVRFGTTGRARIFPFSNNFDDDTLAVAIGGEGTTTINVAQFDERGLIPLGSDRKLGDTFNRWNGGFFNYAFSNVFSFFDDALGNTIGLRMQMRGETLFLERVEGTTELTVTDVLFQVSAAGGFVPQWPADSLFDKLSQITFSWGNTPQGGATIPGVVDGQGGETPRMLLIQEHGVTLLESATPAAARTAIGAASATDLAGKADASHTHTIANVTGLQAALDGKAPTSHTHTIANVTGLQTALDAKANASQQILTHPGGTVNLTAAQNGAFVVFPYDGGGNTNVIINLPPAAAGLRFEFYLDLADSTGNTYNINCDSGDTMILAAIAGFGAVTGGTFLLTENTLNQFTMVAIDADRWIVFLPSGGPSQVP